MVLEFGPDAPPIAHIFAKSLLYTHIGGATAGMITGTVSMIARKGARLHRWAGNVFFVSMLAMAGVGAAVAPFLSKGQLPNTIAGVFTFYLVATAWATVRRPAGQVGVFERAALFAPVAVIVAGLTFEWLNSISPHPIGGPEGVVFFVFAGVAAIAAAGDIRHIGKGGLAGYERTRRHLWRMSLALLIAVGSFAGQPKAIPDFLKGSPLLFLPMLAVLVALFYYLFRTRPRRAKLPTAEPVPA